MHYAHRLNELQDRVDEAYAAESRGEPDYLEMRAAHEAYRRERARLDEAGYVLLRSDEYRAWAVLDPADPRDADVIGRMAGRLRERAA